MNFVFRRHRFYKTISYLGQIDNWKALEEDNKDDDTLYLDSENNGKL